MYVLGSHRFLTPPTKHKQVCRVGNNFVLWRSPIDSIDDIMMVFFCMKLKKHWWEYVLIIINKLLRLPGMRNQEQLTTKKIDQGIKWIKSKMLNAIPFTIIMNRFMLRCLFITIFYHSNYFVCVNCNCCKTFIIHDNLGLQHLICKWSV